MLDELISNLVIGIHTFAQEYERFFLEEQFELFSLSRLKEDIDGADGAVVRIFFSCGTKTGICGHCFFCLSLTGSRGLWEGMRLAQAVMSMGCG